MSTDTTVRKLNTDLHRLAQAKAAETKAQTNVAKAQATEKSQLGAIATQKQSILDQFGSATTPPDNVTAQKLLNQMYALGQKEVQVQDKAGKQIAADKKAVAKDKKSATADRKKALKDLNPAEYHLSLKATNADRKQLGLKALKKPLRVSGVSAGMTKAVSIAKKAVELEQSQHCYDYTQSFGGRTNFGLGPTGKQRDGRISYDCSGFVGAVYKAAGLPSPYTVGYEGTSFDVAGCKNMKQVSESQAKPGDVVVFPDHIALYIGGGKCISMGQEGDPAIVTVAAEAAYHNRGIQGFYHPRSA